MKCPNISHPDWKRLVELIGEDNAYLAYLRNNEDIPDPSLFEEFTPESYSLASTHNPFEIQEESLLLPGFESFYHQRVALDLITNFAINFYDQPKEDGKSYFIRTDALGAFEKGLDAILAENPDNKAWKVVKDNFKELGDIAIEKIRNLGLISDKTALEEDIELNGIDAIFADGSNDYRTDDWAFKYDAKGNALRQLKKFLAFIPKTTYNKDTQSYTEEGTYLDIPGSKVLPHVPDYMGYDSIFEELRAILSDKAPTWDAMVEELHKFEISKPWVHKLLNLLSKAKDQERLKKQFVTTMSSSYADAKTLLWKERNGSYYLNIIDTDQTSVEKTIKSIWGSEYRTSNLLKVDEDNDLVTNRETVDALISKINDTASNPTKATVLSLLEAVGITIAPEVLDQLVNKSFNKVKDIKGQFVEKNGLFYLIKQRLQGKEQAVEGEVLDQEETKADANNPIVNNSAVSALARLEASYNPYAFSNSYRAGDNTIRYSYSYNKALTRKYRRLMEDRAFVNQALGITFTKPITYNNEVVYKSWLYQLGTDASGVYRNQQFRNIFKISPFDTIRQSRPGATGLTLTQMSELDLEVAKVAMMQNSGNSIKGVDRIIKHLVTVPSKTGAYVVQAEGHSTGMIFENGTFSFSPATRNALYSIAAAEHNRVLSQQTRTNGNKAYNKGSSLFYFFPVLNQETSPELYNNDGTILLPTTVLDNGKTVEQFIRAKVLSSIREDIASKITNWESLGLIENGELKIVDNNYLRRVVERNVGDNKTNAITYAAADYIINATLAQFNTHQVFIGDPALYYKNSVEETWDNIDKRLAALTAPGRDLALETGTEQFISIKLVDREKGNSALNYAQISKRLADYYEKQGIKNPYEDIDGTDAQEYTTLKEDLYVKYSLGLLPTSVYSSILRRIDEDGDNLVLTKAQLEGVLGATKPVYSDSTIHTDEDYIAEDYVKSSSIPLLPQFTKDLEIDKLRKAMEAHEKKTGINVRAVFNSGTKVGGEKSINIWNPDGTIKPDLDLEGYGTTLNRIGFSIQQEIPYDEQKKEVVKATQPTKQLFDALLGVEGFRYEHQSYTGAQLLHEYTTLHRELYESGLESLEKKILTNGKIDKVKLQKIIEAEGETRGWSHSEMSFIKLNLDKTDFNLPLWASPTSNRIEALLSSLYNNAVLRQKLHGRSYVLVSEEGFQGRSSGTTYTDSYNPKTGLQPMRIVYKKEDNILEEEAYSKLSSSEKEEYKEVIEPAQVLIAWNLKNKDGKKLNIKDYINDQGFIDTTKVPKEILTQFGFRIPCQGTNSTSLIKVVGFIPDVSGDVIIAPRNFVVQMGSDFDVDKLYVYDYYLKETDGKLFKVDNLKNKIVDIHKSILYNPAVYNSVIRPTDLGNLKYKTTSGEAKGIAVELKKISQKTPSNYLNPDYSKNKYLQAVDGKTMVGIEALSNTSSILFQGKNMSLQRQTVIDGHTVSVPDYIVFGTDEDKILALTDLSSPYTHTGRKKNEVNSAYLSAAVDNEKDPILDFINSNPIVASVQTLLRNLGMEEDLSLFLALPVIREYADAVRKNKSSLNPGRVSQDSLLSDIIYKYEKLAGESLKYTPEELADIPLRPKDFRQVLYSKNTLLPVTGKVPSLTNNQIQYLAILKFEKAKVYGDTLSRAQGNVNIESGGIGVNLIQVADRSENIGKLGKTPTIKNLEYVLGTFANETLYPLTVSGYAIKNSLLSANDTLNTGELFPYAKDHVISIFNELRDTIGRDITTDDKVACWAGMKSYIYSGIYSVEERERLFFDRGDNKSLNTRIRLLRNSKLKNNAFILRLDLSQVDKTGKKPSYVFYNSAKEANIEEDNIYQALIDLNESNDEEVRGIGRDLVNYFFINGGNQEAREFGKYISAAMIDKIGLASYLRSVEFSDEALLGQSLVEGKAIKPSSYMIQYLQHNPYLLTHLKSESWRDVDYEGINLADAMEVTLPNPLLGKIGELNKSGAGYLPIFTVRGATKSNGYGIFIFDKYADKGARYIRIPALGTKFFNEYTKVRINEIKLSLLNKQTTKTEKIEVSVPFENPEQNKLAAPTEVTPNPELIAAVQPLINTDLVDALSHIDSTPYNTALAELFSKVGNIFSDIKIKIDSSEAMKLAVGRYTYQTRTISINPNNLKANKEDYENVILVETVHALIHSINNGEFQATAEQKEAIKALKNIYNNVRDRVLAGELENLGLSAKTLNEFDRILSKDRNKKPGTEVLTAEEAKFLTANSLKYYGISAILNEKGEVIKEMWEDFVHDALTNPLFRETLNHIPHSAKKSILERFGDLIKSILDQLRELVNIKKNSKLEATFANVIKLVQQPDIKSSASDSAIQSNIEYSISSDNAAEKNEKIYKTIINDFQSRIDSISKNISVAELENDKALATRLITRRKEVIDQMNDLIDKNSFQGVVDQAKIDLKYVREILAKDNLSTQDLRFSEKILATWTKITNPQYGVIDHLDIDGDTARYKESRAIVNDATELSEKLSSVQLGTLYSLVKKEAPDVEVTLEQLQSIKDISLLQAQLRDISTSDNLVLSVMSKWIREANLNAKTDANEMITKLEDILEKLHNHPLFKEKGYQQIFGQEDSSNNYTGEIVDALTSEYYTTIEKLLDDAQNAPSPGFRNKAWKKYYEWIRDNHIIVDIRKIYNIASNGLYTYIDNPTYLTQLEKALGEDYTKVLAKAKANIEKYNEELQNQIDSHTGDLDIERILEKWKAENDPSIYLRNLTQEFTRQVIDGKTIYNKGWKYVTRRAVSKWEDQKYNAIQKDDILREFYDFYVDTLSELQHYLPHHLREELSPTDIPSINKNLVEQLRSQSIGGGMGLVWSKVLENLSVTDNNTDQGIIDPITGKKEKEFKIKYLQNINPNDKSYDLGRVLKLFAVEALEYKHKSLIEDQLRLAETILTRAYEKQTTSVVKGEESKSTLKGLRNLYDQLDYAMEVFYGNRRENPKANTETKGFLTPEGKKKLEEDIASIEASDRKAESKAIAIEDARKKHTRYYSFSRMGDALLQYVQIKGMGWNIFGGFNNLAFGYVANWNWAAGGVDFSNKDLLRATGQMMSYDTETVDFINEWMNKLDTVKELNDLANRPTTNNNKVRKGIEMIAPYELYRKGEYFVQGQTMVSLMIAKKLELVNKKTNTKETVSLYDAAKNPDVYDLPESWQKRGKDLLNFKIHMDQIIKTIHGNYDPNSPVLLKKHMMGRALLQFRSWVAEGVAVRFDSEKYDLMLQRTRKGRYRTYGQLGFTESLKTLSRQILYRNSDEAFNHLHLSEADLSLVKENMKRNLNELYQLVGMYTLYLILSNLAIDRDDWVKRAARNYAINSLLRLSDDIEFFVSPAAMENISRSAIPAFTIIIDGGKLVDAVKDTILGDGEYKNGVHAHKSKLFYRSMRMVPGGAAVIANINKASSAENFR